MNCPRCGSESYELKSRNKRTCKNTACSYQFSPLTGTPASYNKKPSSFYDEIRKMYIDGMTIANIAKTGIGTYKTIAEFIRKDTVMAETMRSEAEARAERKKAYKSSPIGRYQARPTNNVFRVGLNSLTELIVRPGIRKFLWPLLLYRGRMDPGSAHRLWNVSLLMMAAEAETLADGLKIIQNPAFAQLCGPPRIPSKIVLWSFFGRLYSSPDVTDNIPGFTDYVKSLGLGPCTLAPVPLETDRQFCAPWRKSNHPDWDPSAEKPESGLRNLQYPYIIHEAGSNGEHDLALFVNSLVPKYLPEQVRADACQDLVVGLLTGEISTGTAHDWVNEYIRRAYRLHPQLYDHGNLAISFNQPIIGSDANEDGIMWADRV